MLKERQINYIIFDRGVDVGDQVTANLVRVVGDKQQGGEGRVR